MSDLISREALMEYARNHVDHTIDCNDIARFPAVDAEPVRHGEWLLIEDYRVCSECRAIPVDWEATPDNPLGCLPPFCHSCGAKMDGGAEE